MERLFYAVAIETDFSPITNFFQQTPDKMLLQFLFSFGWIPIAAVFVWGVVQLWVFYCQSQFSQTLRYSLLAIDIPRANEQSPKAVENVFAYFAGAHSTFNLIEKYWLGQYQQAFSFEIVSIEGYTQFLVWCPAQFRNLTETAIYSQYPDAEITEVNDYTTDIPTQYPDEEYDLWGCEYIPTKHWAYPIKTWQRFEHQFGRPEEQFRDPMAFLMDLYSSLGKGEQLWHQIIVYPTGYDWPEEGEKEISKILGEKIPKKKNIAEILIDLTFGLLTTVSNMIYTIGDGTTETKKDDDAKFTMMNLKPKEKKQIEAIHEKIGQLGFQVKIRFIYVAKKEVMNSLKARNGFIGYMKLYMDLDTNNLRPDMSTTATSAEYFFEKSTKNAKKSRIIAGYKSRSGTRGKKRFILNIEELATLWHFPIEAVVKAPLIQKAPGRKSVPPIALPTLSEEEIDSRLFDDGGAREHEDIFSDHYLEKDQATGAKLERLPVGLPVASDDDDDDNLFDLETPEPKLPAEAETKAASTGEAPAAPKASPRPESPPRKKGSPPANLPFA